EHRAHAAAAEREQRRQKFEDGEGNQFARGARLVEDYVDRLVVRAERNQLARIERDVSEPANPGEQAADQELDRMRRAQIDEEGARAAKAVGEVHRDK